MTTFSDLGLNPMVLQALAEIGFEKPTLIQSKAIPRLLTSQKDLIALAQTGTGKTAAFALPIIQQLSNDTNNVQSLILCPTRELALQIAKDIENYMKYMKGLQVAPVYGGERIDKQIRTLKKKPQIVVGTPGRVNDMIRRKILKVENLRWLVLDEADEMLNMGFKEELDEILKNIPTDKQVLLFSATMNKAVRRIADSYMKKPEDLTIGEKNKGAEGVEHFYYIVHEKDRYQVLKRIADLNPDIHGIVFCRTRRDTQYVADKLIQDGYSAEAIHGDISQEQRTNVMNRFKDRGIQILVATDVAARGVDVRGLTHVINYGMPDSGETYVHRSGRTGRAHNVGVSLLIVNMREKYKVRELERKIGKKFEKGHIPSGDEICEKQLFKLVDKVCDVKVDEIQIGKYMSLINKKLTEMDREELIKKFISVEFNRFLNQYQYAADLNLGIEKSKNEKSNILFSRLRINIGKKVHFGIKDLFTLLNKDGKFKGVEIGEIEIKDQETIFELDERYKDRVMQYLTDLKIGAIRLKPICEASGVESMGHRGKKNGEGKNNKRYKKEKKGYKSNDQHKPKKYKFKKKY